MTAQHTRLRDSGQPRQNAGHLQNLLKVSADAADGLDGIVEGVACRERFVLGMQVRLRESAEAFFEKRETCPRVIRFVFGRDAPEVVERTASALRFLNYTPLQKLRDI